ncbi:MAG: tRNA (adenosine(37)-N6)-dimethylallyltransferase MiaA [Phycisphaeraceae bacterium]
MPASRAIVILGPTAGGKSSLAVSLAAALTPAGEIISADSMQVYRRLDAGTAKPTRAQREAVPHHLVDAVDTTEPFTVADWLRRAERAMEQVRGRGHRPIIVGGTNLYLQALLSGLFEGPDPDPALRKELEARGGDALHVRLRETDPEAAKRISPRDLPRLIRAMEVYELTGQTITSLQQQWDRAVSEGPYRHDPILIGLHYPPEAINPRINLRVKAMFHPDKVDPELAASVCIGGESLPEEAKRLRAEGWLGDEVAPQASQALGYKQALAVLQRSDPKLATMDDAFERTKILTRRFAKQQRVWLKRFRGVHWIDAAGLDAKAITDQAIAVVSGSPAS